jgi:hypothetical protein
MVNLVGLDAGATNPNPCPLVSSFTSDATKQSLLILLRNEIRAASISADEAAVNTAFALPVPKVAMPESRFPSAHAPVVSIKRFPRQISAAAFVVC